MYTGTNNKNKVQTPEKVQQTKSTPLNTHQCAERGQPSKEVRLNKIINKEELTKQLTFYSQSSNGLDDLIANYLQNHYSGQPHIFIHTRKSSEGPTWLKRAEADPKSFT